jgi:hypothetical protein
MLRSIFLLFVLLALLTIVKEKDEQLRLEDGNSTNLSTHSLGDSIKFSQEFVNTKRQSR